jgi:hypothetical protein
MRPVGAACALALLAAPAAAQDRVVTKYWDQLEIGWPVPQEALDRTPRPAKVRLYAAVNRGPFEQAFERAADDLVPIPGRQPGFLYTAAGDGEVEFAVQLVYADGKTAPPTDRLQPLYRVVFDTRPPSATLSPAGQYGVEWTVADENLDPAGTKLECRWVGGDPRWHPVQPPRGGWAARDRYSWAGLARDGRTLEVRVTAEDKAGHKTSSRIVRLPAAGSTGFPRDDDATPRDRDRGTPPPADRDVPGQPQIIYANNPALTLKSKLVTVTRSGVRAIHLWMKEMSDGAGGEWKHVKEYPTTIEYGAADPAVELGYTVAKDGRYGFIVIPESGAGKKDPNPRPAAPPQYLVEVDTKAPYVKVTNVTVAPGGAAGPRVEIEWEAVDPNLMTEPIVLEWASGPQAEKWFPIAEKLPNSRRYVWEVSDKQPYKFVVRARAVDKATNTATHVYDKEVNIDLDRPSATIEAVRPGPGGAAGVAPAPAPAAGGNRPTTPPAAPPSRDPAPAGPSPGLVVPSPLGPTRN